MRNANLNQDAARAEHVTRDPANPYVQCTEHYGRIDLEFMLDEFAAALAPHIGATVTTEGSSRNLVLPNGVEIWARAEYGAKTGLVSLGACYPDTVVRRRNNVTLPGLPSITVNAGRPLEKLAKDIARRLVEPAAPLVAGAVAQVQEFEQAAATFAAKCRSLEGQIPGLRLEPDGLSARLWLSTARGHVSGRLNADGTAWYERISWTGDFRDFARLFREEA